MIVVGGEALIDMIMTFDGRFSPVPGGGPYNTARTLGRLGSDVAFLGRLSDDRFGRLMLERLRDDGVGTDLVVPTSDPSTIVLAEIDAEGVAHYRFYLAGTSAPGLEVEDARHALESVPEALHVGTLGLAVDPMAGALEMLVAEAPPSTLVMIDPNCRAMAVNDADAFRRRMARVLARADIVKVSHEDLDYLAPAEAPLAAAESILRDGAGVVLVTGGGGAVHVVWPGGTLEVAVAPVEVVDTIGAGDAFGGGFLARWLELGGGRPGAQDRARLADATSFGVRVAAVTVGREGADPPTRADLT